MNSRSQCTWLLPELCTTEHEGPRVIAKARYFQRLARAHRVYCSGSPDSGGCDGRDMLYVDVFNSVSFEVVCSDHLREIPSRVGLLLNLHTGDLICTRCSQSFDRHRCVDALAHNSLVYLITLVNNALSQNGTHSQTAVVNGTSSTDASVAAKIHNCIQFLINVQLQIRTTIMNLNMNNNNTASTSSSSSSSSPNNDSSSSSKLVLNPNTQHWLPAASQLLCRHLNFSVPTPSSSPSSSASTLLSNNPSPPLMHMHLPRGLQNLGNSCFLNASLQSLAHCSSAARYLRRYARSVGRGGALTHTFHSLIRALRPTQQLRFTASNNTASATNSASSSSNTLSSSFSSYAPFFASSAMSQSNRSTNLAGSPTSICPTAFVRQLQAVVPSFRVSQQQDAHEFVRLLLDHLHESLKEPQGVSSVISQLFGGQLVSRTRCSRCGHVSSARERFLDLSLSIAFESSSAQTNNNNNSNHSLDTQSDDTSQRLVQPSSIMDVVDEENSSRSYTSWFSFAASWLGFDRFQSTTLRSCLRKFIQPEILSGANQCTCERCNTKCDTYKQMLLSLPLPDTLVLHLKRFRYDSFFSSSKISTYVQFPLDRLDMREFCDEDTHQNASSSSQPLPAASIRNNHNTSTLNGYHSPQNTNTNDPQTSHFFSQTENSQQQRHDPQQNPHHHQQQQQQQHLFLDSTDYNTTFQCMAVVKHIGSIGGGHYIAYVRESHSNRWFECDDTNVREVSVDVVANTEAYLLFYAKQQSLLRQTRIKHVKALMNNWHQSVFAKAAAAVSLSNSFNSFSPSSQAPQLSSSTSSYVYAPSLAFVTPDDVEPFVYIWAETYFALVTLGESPLGSELHRTPRPCIHGLTRLSVADREQLLAVPLSALRLLSPLLPPDAPPPIYSLDVCVECERERVALLAARASEKSRVLSLDRPFLKAGECWYLLPAEWLHRWHAYVADENGDVPSPGAINNLQLLMPDQRTPRPNLQRCVHYRGVVRAVWDFFVSVYGGGPPLPRRALDIYSM